MVRPQDSLNLFTAMVDLTMMLSSFNIWQLVNRQYVLLLTLQRVLVCSEALITVLTSSGQVGFKPGCFWKQCGEHWHDQQKWRQGLERGAIYYDKQAPFVLVGKMFGVGWAFNFARQLSRIMLILPIGLPIIIVIMMRLIAH